MNVTVEIPELTGAECGDIAITAAEGGIGYWSRIESYQYLRWSGGPDDVAQDCIEVAADFVFYTIEFENPDSNDPPRLKADITPELFRRGFKAMAEADNDKGGWPVPKLLGMAREDWTGEIDSDIADMLVQFGVFGKVVFG